MDGLVTEHGTPAAERQGSRLRSPAARSLPPDDELVTRLRAGDEAAFASLVDAWSSGMVRLARSFVSTEESAAEVVQDAWLAVVAGLTGYEGRSSLRTWVYRILVNIAKRRWRQENRGIPWSSLSIGEDDGPTVDPGRFRGAGEPYAGHWREFPARGRHRNRNCWPLRSGHRSPPHSPDCPPCNEL